MTGFGIKGFPLGLKLMVWLPAEVWDVGASELDFTRGFLHLHVSGLGFRVLGLGFRGDLLINGLFGP